MKTVMLYITASNKDEAVSLASMLLAERKIACANILDGVLSLYWWQGEIERNPEAVIIAKTTEQHVAEVITRVKAEHSYSNPCVVAWPIDKGNLDFLDWIKRETAPTA